MTYFAICILHLLQNVGFEDLETTHFSTILVINESPFISIIGKNQKVLVRLENIKPLKCVYQKMFVYHTRFYSGYSFCVFHIKIDRGFES